MHLLIKSETGEMFVTLFFLVFIPTSIPLETPNMEPLMKGMTTALITMLNNETKEGPDYKPTSVADIMNITRRQLYANYDGNHHYHSYYDRVRACYSISITYKNALWNLRRYFHIRWLYVENLEFEVGYLVHEIIHRYQIVLELYQMTEQRFLKNQNQNYAWSSYMLYIYVNILEQCKVIIHFCNMLHELEAKYRRIKSKKAGIFDDYIDEKDIKIGRTNVSDVLAKERLAYLLFEREQRKKLKRQAKQKKEQRNMMLKFGKTTAWVRTRPTKFKHHDIIYGWSIENWWDVGKK